jgi:hypothetical protein
MELGFTYKMCNEHIFLYKWQINHKKLALRKNDIITVPLHQWYSLEIKNKPKIKPIFFIAANLFSANGKYNEL